MKERALSEVIGFLMIVALLTILFSMYLLYVVPIQGRDAEISHMKYITQEFIGLKADIDGLIINNKINMPIARSFELGTLSSVGMGALSIMPVSSFVEASGTLMVNEQNDFLKVAISGDVIDANNLASVINPLWTQNQSAWMQNQSYYTRGLLTNQTIEFRCESPDQCPWPPINFTISDRFYNITTRGRYSFNDSLVDPTTSQLNIKNTTIRELKFENGTTVSMLVPDILINKTYDLVLETFENVTLNPGPYMSEKTLIENLTFPRNYTYDILKDNDILLNNSTEYAYSNYNSDYYSGSITSEEYTDTTVYTKVGRYPPRIGSFQYESSNRYWVNQNLMYELGGLILTQPADGGSSVMLIPSIAMTLGKNLSDPDPDLRVSINNIRITDTEDISGSVSAQIFSKIDKINQNLINGTTIPSDFGIEASSVSLWKIREGGVPNARAVWLQFIPDDPRVKNSTLPLDGTIDITKPEYQYPMMNTTKLWKRGFDQIKTISNKTFSEVAGFSGVADYANYLNTFVIADPTHNPPYTANVVIGEFSKEVKDSCQGTWSAACDNAMNKFLSRPDNKKFILDYVDSEVSLVMQSGAL